ncbi:unnamed protein product [Camellia sinensis]
MGVSKGNLPTVASEGCYVMERGLGSVVTMEDGPNEKCPLRTSRRFSNHFQGLQMQSFQGI